MNAAISTSVTAATADTMTKAQRQPIVCPIHVATGLPTRMAMVSPNMVRLTALPRSSGLLIATAASAATPKYAPCGRPATKRASIMLT
jgi:hypothetical protein